MGLKDFGLVVGVFVLWFALNRWVLPWMGISTCMSGGCGGGACRTSREPVQDEIEQEGSQPEELR